jgi:membrane protein
VHALALPRFVLLKEHFGFLRDLFSKTLDRYDELDGLRLGASFSYYATFAIFPLVLLTVTVVGFVIGDDAATRGRVVAWASGANDSVRSVLDQALTSMQASGGARKTSAIIALASLFFSASGVFVELDYTLNKIWGLRPRVGKGLFDKVKIFASERLSGIACILGIGFFMLISLVVSTVLGVVAQHVNYMWTPALLRTAELATSIALISLAFAAMFHFVPRSRPPFHEVIGGAVVTTVLLTILKALFAFYLSRLTSYSAYGVVGGVLALATWIYLSAQLIFFGATLTRVHGEMTSIATSDTNREVERETQLRRGDGDAPTRRPDREVPSR